MGDKAAKQSQLKVLKSATIEKMISKIRKTSSDNTVGDRQCRDIQLFVYRQLLKYMNGEIDELDVMIFKRK